MDSPPGNDGSYQEADYDSAEARARRARSQAALALSQLRSKLAKGPYSAADVDWAMGQVEPACVPSATLQYTIKGIKYRGVSPAFQMLVLLLEHRGQGGSSSSSRERQQQQQQPRQQQQQQHAGGTGAAAAAVAAAERLLCDLPAGEEASRGDVMLQLEEMQQKHFEKYVGREAKFDQLIVEKWALPQYLCSYNFMSAYLQSADKKDAWRALHPDKNPGDARLFNDRFQCLNAPGYKPCPPKPDCLEMHGPYKLQEAIKMLVEERQQRASDNARVKAVMQQLIRECAAGSSKQEELDKLHAKINGVFEEFSPNKRQRT